MNAAYQPVVEVLGDTLALMTRRERGVWSLHDTYMNILAIAKGRFKARPRRKRCQGPAPPPQRRSRSTLSRRS